MNGTALTDTITTDCFLEDFQLTFATLFSGVRHDSGDPLVWGEKMIKHYEKLGIDTKTKTLLFSDSLDFERADKICRHFSKKAKVAFGIGTYLSNDTSVNHVCRTYDLSKGEFPICSLRRIAWKTRIKEIFTTVNNRTGLIECSCSSKIPPVIQISPFSR